MKGIPENNHSFQNYWSSFSENIDLYLFECGYEKCDPCHYWGPGIKGHHVFHYVISGKGKLTIAQKTYDIQAGDFFYVPDDSVVFYQADGATPWEYRWIGFRGTKANLIIGLTAFSKEDPVVHAKEHEDFLLGSLNSIYQSSMHSTGLNLGITGKLYLFLDELCRLFPKLKKEVSSSMEQSYVDRALYYIQLNYHLDCSINRMSRELGLNRTYIFKLFKKHLGLSPTAYIKQLRIDNACALIKSRKYTLQEIALKVGYNDPFYFSKIFKEVKHEPPFSYMKKFQNA